MLSLEAISLQYAGKTLYDEITATISTRDRIALVGSNGAGKTTLLKVILGKVSPDAGDVTKAHHMTLGYLPQEGIATKGKSVYEEAKSAFDDILSLRRRIDSVFEEIQEMDPASESYLEALDMIGAWEHKLQDLEEHRLQSKVETVLTGLGFKLSDLQRDCGEFSGGWQMRIALAKLLLQEPSLLLLDEPTNHLDLPSLRWFEQFLKKYEGTLLMISHDRSFLDGLCSQTFELTMGKLHTYKGNYSFYEVESKRRKELALQAYRTQQKEIEKTEQFINRFRAKATKAKQVQSRIKALDKVERLTIEKEESRIQFSFPAAPKCGHSVLELDAVSKSYADLTVFKNISLKLERGDRIAVVGANGAGKSTLAKVMAGREPFQSGERILGHKVELSYFAQQQAEALNLEKNVLEIAEEAAEKYLKGQARTILGSFLFRGDDVFKKVKVLSGGEKCRLALACLLLQKANCLILDEPTNHLDMKSKEILRNALCTYEGTLVIVSHDRDFLEPVVNKVWDVTKGRVEVHLGKISDYILELEKQEEEALKAEKRSARASVKETKQLSPKERRRLEAERREALKPLKKEVQVLEKDIERLEAKKSELEAQLADPNFFNDNPEAPKTAKDHHAIQEKLEKLLNKWESLTQKIESIQSD